MDLASLAPLAQLTATGALILILLLLFRAVSSGDWVSRRELDYLREDRDNRLREKDTEIAEWRAVGETERAGRELATAQVTQLLGGFSTVNRLLDALRTHQEGGPDDVATT